MSPCRQKRMRINGDYRPVALIKVMPYSSDFTTGPFIVVHIFGSSNLCQLPNAYPDRITCQHVKTKVLLSLLLALSGHEVHRHWTDDTSVTPYPVLGLKAFSRVVVCRSGGSGAGTSWSQFRAHDFCVDVVGRHDPINCWRIC